jgi:hypothetical protein
MPRDSTQFLVLSLLETIALATRIIHSTLYLDQTNNQLWHCLRRSFV